MHFILKRRERLCVRKHVERFIGVVRQKYTILSGILPVDYLLCSDASLSTIDNICHICCVLINLCDSIII